MSDLSDILASKHLPTEPPEFSVIRDFVKEHFDVTPKLQLRDQSIIISLPGSAVAGSLRFQLPQLQALLNTDYKLIISSH